MDAGTAGRAERVLVLVVAMLTMHGLVGGHHGTVAIAAAGVGEAIGSPAEGEGAARTAVDGLHPGEPGLLAIAATRLPPVAAPHGCDDECSDRFSGLLLLCVATLLGVGVALRRGTARVTWRRALVIVGTAGQLGPRTSVRRRDPVSELCVSRT